MLFTFFKFMFSAYGILLVIDGFLNNNNLSIIGGGFMLAIVGCYIYSKMHSKKQAGELLKNEKQANYTRKAEFTLTHSMGVLEVDTTNKKFKFKNDHKIFNFNELQHFKLYKDNEEVMASINMMGVKLISNPNSTIEKLDLVYIVDGLNSGRYTIPFLSYKVSENSEHFRIKLEQAELTINGLQKILDGSIS